MNTLDRAEIRLNRAHARKSEAFDEVSRIRSEIAKECDDRKIRSLIGDLDVWNDKFNETLREIEIIESILS